MRSKFDTVLPYIAEEGIIRKWAQRGIDHPHPIYSRRHRLANLLRQVRLLPHL
jgi:hypothetical protein